MGRRGDFPMDGQYLPHTGRNGKGDKGVTELRPKNQRVSGQPGVCGSSGEVEPHICRLYGVKGNEHRLGKDTD